MTIEKAIAFLDKLIEDTKRHFIAWERVPNREISGYFDPTKSFQATVKNFEIKLCCSPDDDFGGDIRLTIKYSPELPTVTLDYNDNSEFQQHLIRLFNIVYDQFPNLEKAIDDYLND